MNDNVDLLTERLHALVNNLRDVGYTGVSEHHTSKMAADAILFAMYGGYSGSDEVPPALDIKRAVGKIR